MDPVLVLRDTQLQVRPGDTVRTTATVRNSSDLVEQYALDVLGPAAAWAEVIPSTLSVIRRGESTVQLLFRPPAGPATPAGTLPFALRCVSRDDPGSAAVAEGDLAVGAIHEIVASLEPQVARGRWVGRWTARFENRGTAPARLALAATDERRTLGFALAPAELVVHPGETGVAYLKARASRPAMTGALTRQRVRLTYTRQTDPGEAIAEGFVEVSFEHVPVLSRAVAALAGVALVGAAAAVVLLSRSTPRDETTTPGAPPMKPTAFDAREGEAGAVRLTWSQIPGARSYQVERLDGDLVADATERKAPLSAYDWPQLRGGEQACFRLVAVNDSGMSEPSERRCAQAGVSVAPTPSPPATPSTPTPEPTPGSPASPEPTPTGPTPGPGDPTGPISPTPDGPTTPAAQEPRLAYVVYQIFAKADHYEVTSEIPLQLRADVARTVDTKVFVADTDASTRLHANFRTGGFIALYTDNFTSKADAAQFCKANKENLAQVHAGCDPYGD
ncbi:fibronectin type III domain-containing protein [Frankia sp. QA3]|uniref:fibronectin type III domain-containing protein n=1 Tax=Frankia sp. QA3 TaxID=710111 RepID=UPI000269C015|nr:fibronectin type III domain-containing protein [Frankia sp. QA3]EIV92983.1 hypothetical protein FraQA3DRAFT_2656 [Frankia sp. QA3]